MLIPPVFPHSGRDGYIKLFYGQEVPIYSWKMTSTVARTNYRTSNSGYYSVRNKGLVSDIITIHGVEYVPQLSLDNPVVEIGWIDWANNRRIYLPIDAIFRSYVRELDYTNTTGLSFSWIVTLVDVTHGYKQLTYRPIGAHVPMNDPVDCYYLRCQRYIYSQWKHSQIVEHVTKARIIREWEPINYATSYSLPRLVRTYGNLTQNLELTVQGEFDYWYDKVNFPGTIELGDDYQFWYGPDTLNFILCEKMKVIGLSDLIVNIQTSEIISAVVTLSSSQG